MKTPRIITHQMKNTYAGNHFFILSKGMNAGKPMEKPCPNCFVLFAKSEEEKNQLYWLCFGLWQGNLFRPFLTGSVIPFIRLDDLKTVIENGYDKLELMNGGFNKSIEAIEKLRLYEEGIAKQLQLIKQTGKSLMYRMLR